MNVVPPHWLVPLDDLGIQTVALEDGSLKLHLCSREPAASSGEKDASSASVREPARIITMAWGERYIADLLSVTIPAVLAPGNIPAFAESFDCEFVIVTETRLFEQILIAPVMRKLLQYCDLRLVPVDDLLSHWYGITLTYALVRGYIDLGEAMTSTHLVFLNADFIVADGSYRKLAEVIRRGERLVVSPSYCMVLEQTIETLRGYYDERSCSLAIPKREMAAMILDNRHNTIRAKTVNQRLFRIHRYDQFYWHVDDQTMLGRQMPIAVVYMRPERVILEMPTFWDYGVISEYCPTVKPCVLGDSDDFLMGELRTASTFNELLHLGWPSTDEIAKDLSSFTTKDHHDYGRFPLTLHSADLPAGVEDGEKKLRQFVEEVYSKMSPPISYLNHPFWAEAFPRFSAMAEEGRKKLQATLKARQTLERDPRNKDRILNLLSEMKAVQSQLDSVEGRRITKQEEIAERRQRFEEEIASEKKALEGAESELNQLDSKEMRPLKERFASLSRQRNALLAKLERAEARATERIAQVEEAQKPAESFMMELLRLGPRKVAEPGHARDPRAVGVGETRRTLIGDLVPLLAPVYRKMFGRLPNTTRWHPYNAMLKPAVEAVKGAAHDASNVLVVGSGGPFGSLIVRPLEARKLNLEWGMVSMPGYRNLIQQDAKFDLCLCDVNVEALDELYAVLEKIRPHMAPGGKIVVFHQNIMDRNLDLITYELTLRGFPLFGNSRVVYAGSLPGKLASKWFYRALYSCSIFQLGGLVRVLTTLMVCAPLARIAMWLEEKRDREAFPKHCTSMTIEIDLDK